MDYKKPVYYLLSLLLMFAIAFFIGLIGYINKRPFLYIGIPYCVENFIIMAFSLLFMILVIKELNSIKR